MPRTNQISLLVIILSTVIIGPGHALAQQSAKWDFLTRDQLELIIHRGNDTVPGHKAVYMNLAYNTLHDSVKFFPRDITIDGVDNFDLYYGRCTITARRERCFYTQIDSVRSRCDVRPDTSSTFIIMDSSISVYVNDTFVLSVGDNADDVYQHFPLAEQRCRTQGDCKGFIVPYSRVDQNGKYIYTDAFFYVQFDESGTNVICIGGNSGDY